MQYKFTIKQAREYRGLTIAEMAKKTGLSAASYYRREREPDRMPMELATVISSELNIPMDDLIFCA